MRSIIIFVLAAILFSLGLSYWLASFVVNGNRQTLEEAMQWQSEHFDTAFYRELEKTAYTVRGEGGYELHAEYLKNPDETDKFIIISHGYTDNRMGSLKYVRMYLDLGFNCIIYDLRGHGENSQTITTYGLLEGKDLAALVKDTRSRYPDLTQLGLHGESLGAAAVITSLKYEPEVDFAVADCGFSDIENVLRKGYRDAHIPVFLVDMADFGMRLRYQISLKEMRPIDSLDENRIPVLFIHGAEDSFIIPKNSEDMYDRTQGVKEIHMISGAGHAESILTDPESYQKYVAAFLQRLFQ